MHIHIDSKDFQAPEGQYQNLSQIPTYINPLYKDKKDYKSLLKEYKKEIYDLQNILYAHDRYALLLIFQGMDTAGKDGAIKHVMSGINPAGVQVFSFKKPGAEDLDHDFMWRAMKRLPERGRIGIFNRSYYEEVLVVRVHPKILTEIQRVPDVHKQDLPNVWKQRYQDMVNTEAYLHRNGIRTLKFFIHISKEEQRRRLLERIERPEKNWKMSLADVEERRYWEAYQEAFAQCIAATSTTDSPWYIIPGDDKKNARLIISQLILQHLQDLPIHYPKVTDSFRQNLEEVRRQLLKGEGE